MKKVLKYLMNDKNKTDARKAVGMSLAVAGLSAAVPYIYGRLVDMISRNNLDDQLIILLGVWLIITLTINIINRYFVRKKHIIAINCQRELVIKCCIQLLAMPMSFHKDKKIGESLDKVTRAGENLHSIITQVVFSALPKFITIVIVLLALLFVVNYKLSLIVLAIIIVYSLMTLFKTRPLEMTEERIDRAFGEANGDMHDSVINAQAVKSFTSEEREAQKFQAGNQKIFSEYLPLLDAWSNLTLVQSSILGIGFIAMIGLSLILLRQSEITAGQLIMLIGYSALVFEPLTSLADNYILIKRGLVSIKRAESLMQEKTESYEGGRILENVIGEVSFGNVSFAYNGDQETLKNINFTARKGKMTALVGESGAGKTTFVELISRLIEPKKGTIRLDGIDIKDINLRSLREKIAGVPQEIMLFNETVKENIRFAKPDATDEEVIQAAMAANAHEFVQKMPNGYEQLVGERGVKLSAGQKQRIAIARAILRNPRILILDEATSALDSKSEKLVQEAVQKLIEGRTVFVIAHRLSTIRKADSILVLKDGEIIEQGTHQELVVAGGIYKELYDLQNF